MPAGSKGDLDRWCNRALIVPALGGVVRAFASNLLVGSSWSIIVAIAGPMPIPAAVSREGVNAAQSKLGVVREMLGEGGR